MKIGVPKEIKTHEYRVGLVPAAIRGLVSDGHEVVVERGAGAGIGFSDENYVAAGATLAEDAAAVFGASDLIVKVKEPQLSECRLLRSDQTLFTYLHLAADRPQTEALLASGATCIAYETVTDTRGGLPLLRPMSEVAGRMSIQVGARFLEREQGGPGILLGGVPGVAPARVAILGGGVAGTNAAQIAIGVGADVTIFDISTTRLAELDQLFGGRIKTGFASTAAVEDAVAAADLVIGAVLVPGAAAPRLVSRTHLGAMRSGSVLVDIAIDQGGCFESSRATTHDRPVYVVDDITHYCVANMPGAVARTSSIALNNVTLPFVARLARDGTARALAADPHFAAGLNVRDGRLVNRAVAEALSMAIAA